MDPVRVIDPVRVWKRSVRRGTLSAALGVMLLTAVAAHADISLPPVSVGAGMQTNFFSCDQGCIYSDGKAKPGSNSVQGFDVSTVRLYLNGSVTDAIKLTFNTEYNQTPNQSPNGIGVLDAIARFEFSDQVNFWAGRFLPASDRANLYGPYYANDWAPYADGVADFYPSIATGRDNGVAYWGQFGALKIQTGVFDGRSLNSAVGDPSKVLVAARLHYDFWDPEPGYYYNATYYGAKDLLAFGIAGQNQDSKTAWSVDGLMEKKLPDMSVVTVEAEYQKDNGLTVPANNHGWYGLVSYLFPQVIGVGKFQLLGKYSQKTTDAHTAVFTTTAQTVDTSTASATAPVITTTTTTSAYLPQDKLKTAEFNLNYIIKTFNARVGFYFLDQKDDIADTTKKEFGLKLQLQL